MQGSNPEILSKNTCSRFHLIGWIGFLFGVALNFLLAEHLGLSLPAVAGYSTLTIFAFYSQAMITKIITGHEDLVYYRQEIIILAVTSFFLKLSGEPVIVYLDFFILGLGMFMVFGRVGCYLSGCCFGRPHRCGVKADARRGYPEYLDGVTILPTQLLESLLALVIVISGVAMIWDNHQPGKALVWYTITYGAGRFLLEYLRGDKRPYWLGMSEAQWTTLLLVHLVLLSGNRGILVIEPWHYAVSAILVVLAVATVMFRLICPDHFHTFHPNHVLELIKAIKKIDVQTSGTTTDNPDPDLHSGIGTYATSAGLVLSGGPLPGTPTHNVTTLSGEKPVLSRARAMHIFALIRHVQNRQGYEFEIYDNNGIYHMVTYPSC